MSSIRCSKVLPGAILVLAIGGMGSAAFAVPIYYGATGHYYDFIDAPRIRWTEAFQGAPTHTYAGETGYLATVTSAGENDFMYQLFGRIFWEGWLGGWQTPGSRPAENWHWVTGEPWNFTNWANGEPNDGAGTGAEDYLQMWGWGTTGEGKWNDDANDTDLGNIRGYLIEYGDAPPPPMPPVPEPATVVLLALGLLGSGTLSLWRRP